MPNSYDVVPYFGAPFAQTHPDRLATMAALFGMTPTPIDRARVLEIGCCDGGNILPMALSLPGSEFIGIDLAESAIANACESVAALGLSNIRFHALDLTTLPGSFGRFDYILAHGLYSWVPGHVREKLIAVAKAMLAPHGVAYISYNALPGGHLRLMLREMMLFHIRGADNPAEVLSRSRWLLEFIASATGGENEYHSFVHKEIEQILSRPDSGLYHDELEEHYHPVYFHEFMAHAARHGLQYLSEANYFDMRAETLGASAASALAELSGDRLIREQYLDFGRSRRFRQTLLCHDDLPLDPAIPPARLQSFFLASPAHLVSSENQVEEFHGPHYSKIKTAHPLVRRLLHHLIDAWPRAVPFDELPSVSSELDEACAVLHAMFAAGLVEVRTSQPQFALTPGERPVASPLARLQASRSRPLTTLRHTTITTTGPVENRLISLLDGARTRVDLLSTLTPLIESAKSPEQLAAELDTSLNTLGRLCLLIS